MPKRAVNILVGLTLVLIGLLPLSTLGSGPNAEKIVFVRADPSMGVQSIQQVTDANEFAVPTNWEYPRITTTHPNSRRRLLAIPRRMKLD